MRRVDTAASEAAAEQEQWYRRYIPHFRELTRLSAGAHAGLIASDGLDALHHTMRFRRLGAEGSTLEAIGVPRAHYFDSFVIRGSGPRTEQLILFDDDLEVRGAALEQLLERWRDEGVAEPSAVDALLTLAQNPEWLDLSDSTFVVMGAGAEMGPLRSLLRWGAHVIAIDLPGAARWRPLIAAARRSPGRLTVPIRSMPAVDSDANIAAAAGADVITEAPEIADWLLHTTGPFVLGDYVYAPGETQVRTTTAVDAIILTLLERRKDVGLAYLATPTDVYAVPGDAVRMSQGRYEDAGPLVSIARELGAHRIFRPNYSSIHNLPSGRRFGLIDGLIAQQGANYALAKRVQRWRALRARTHGSWVSSNVAPPTRTQSVVNNRILASAYGGAHRFGLHVFTPAASSLAMSALLVHDLRNRTSLAHPDVPLDTSMDFVADEALHGGIWRAAYTPRSVLGFASATGRFTRT
jgi:hypothetical protein